MRRASNEIPVRILDFPKRLKPSNAFVVVLKETFERHRKMFVIIGELEAEGVQRALVHERLPRPSTHELMLNVMMEGGLKPVKGVVTDVKEGIYYSLLYVKCKDGNIFQVDARTTDVISLSLWYGFPMYVLNDVLEREQIFTTVREEKKGYLVSWNMMDLDMLKQEMELAVKREDYELAAELRDEIRAREAGKQQTKE